MSAAAACVRNENDPSACAPSRFYPGPDLFSRGPTSRVASALAGLTAVFGMGTGVAPPLQGPRIQVYRTCLATVNARARGAQHRSPRASLREFVGQLWKDVRPDDPAK